jgi:hypothetical protein
MTKTNLNFKDGETAIKNLLVLTRATQPERESESQAQATLIIQNLKERGFLK